MKEFGGVLLGIGLLIMAAALMYEPTVSTGYTGSTYGVDVSRETYNIGKMQYQGLFFLGGCAIFLAGSVFLAAGSIVSRLEQSGVIKPLPTAVVAQAAPTTSCEWCGVEVAEPIKPCSALEIETWPEVAPRIRATR